MLLPTKFPTLVHSVVWPPELLSEKSQRSSLLILLLSILMLSLVVGVLIVKSASSKLPCLNCIKNPVLELPGP